QVDIFDPAVNLAFGQQNLEMLRDSPATGGALPKIMAAYNAGLTPVTRWNYEINDQGDPLLWMESIPYWETRGYVAIVMRNYWMYERQARAASPSRTALAQNAWPAFPSADEAGSRRVYLSAEADCWRATKAARSSPSRSPSSRYPTRAGRTRIPRATFSPSASRPPGTVSRPGRSKRTTSKRSRGGSTTGSTIRRSTR